MSETGRGHVALVAFYNKKALGVRYLSAALRRDGYEPSVVFFKDFNSVRPAMAEAADLDLLVAELRRIRPLFIGLSVMSSMYLESVYAVLARLREERLAPIVCGGAYATMFPERLIERGADYVLRSDGEINMLRLADALRSGGITNGIPSLVRREDGKIRANPIGGLLADIDGYGLPDINCPGSCLIEGGRLTRGDPQLGIRSYEVVASRGCPFTCSYCCCVNLRRLLPEGIPGVRTRSAESVVSELEEAKRQCKRLLHVHFYDEVFPNLPGWVDEFCREYGRRVRLPFTIWSHPRMADAEILRKLKSVGLREVIMGIQSGSERVRREVFHRYETQEDILRAVSAINSLGLLSCFDLMLQHPFETVDDLKETYYLVKRLPGRYELQLHGLNFLPGTDIVEMAVEQSVFTREEIERVMYAPMAEQFAAYWKREASAESQAWYELIYCWQFAALRPALRSLEAAPEKHLRHLHRLYMLARRLAAVRRTYRKAVKALPVGAAL